MALFELWALLVGLAFGGLLAAALRQAYDFDTRALARQYVLVAEKSAIGTVHLRGTAKSCGVALQ